MAAGTYTTQNKVRPGIYVNFESQPKPAGGFGDRGTVTIPLALSWGAPNTVLTVEAGEDTFGKLGYTVADPKLRLLREALKRAKTLLVYRLNEGTKASIANEGLTVTARWGGLRGNDITVAVEPSVDDSGLFEVATLVAGFEVDRQTVAAIDALQANEWVVFGGTGAPSLSAGLPLTGGSDGTVLNQHYADYLETIETQDFNTMALPSADATLKGQFVSFCERMREEEGRKMQLVVENYPAADYEGVISVKNGVVLADGTALTAAECTAWTAGATAGANVNESLTYTAYDGAVDAAPRLTNSQIIAALQAGEFVFTASGNRAVVEQDINTRTSFTPEKGKAFSKNRVLRVLDGINNDFVRTFGNYFVGRVANNDNGRNLLKNECVDYLKALLNIGAIQSFDAQQDIKVLQGADADSVSIEAVVTPADSIEKIYVKVTVQ
ncbi:phage tail sheath family protein [Paenibacillus glycinis]|uniref:Phage tail sheath protein n=1 Tax=Paenibacillus glycinis TaxID=2697035 RepID=A0ABW9XNW4_9BACL|nr:phage tail sheath family protein [Paenibacillus glycinis]NBD24323.1 phage tail sheath protein [Paenibacillus glycinis]